MIMIKYRYYIDNQKDYNNTKDKEAENNMIFGMCIGICIKKQ